MILKFYYYYTTTTVLGRCTGQPAKVIRHPT